VPYPLDALVAAFLADRFVITTHAAGEMLTDRVQLGDLVRALTEDAPEPLEEDTRDPRGPECLILAWTPEGRPLHVKIGYTEYRQPDVITVYAPDPAQWINLRRRASPHDGA
jgi:hypothetical protein